MTPDHLDQVRPALHFTAPVNWLNDPNGLIEHDGRFHLFYQHNPDAPVWARPHWGHASSDDLLHWEHHPIALTPSDWFDEAGCYSGCTVIDDDGTPTILYTGVSHGPHGLVEKVILATGSDDLLTWAKYPHPVIDGPPPGMSLDGFRDPFVWREADGQWSLILGAGHDGEGMVLLYRSPDLRTWTYTGVLLHQSDTGSDLTQAGLWECPQLVRLADTDVLLLSVHRGTPQHVVALEGILDADRFHVTGAQLMDLGPNFYAPHAFTTEAGNALVLGWLRDSTAATSPTWVGAISLPRRLRSNHLGELEQHLAVDLKAIPTRVTPTATPSGALACTFPTGPSRLDLDLIARSTTLTLDIGWTGDDSIDTSIVVETRPGTDDEQPEGGVARVWRGTVVVDAPVVEIFARTGQVASVLLPRRAPSLPLVALTVRGDGVDVRHDATGAIHDPTPRSDIDSVHSGEAHA